MTRHHDAPGQGFLFPDGPQRVNKTTLESGSHNVDWSREVELPPSPHPQRAPIPASIPELIERCSLPLLRADRFDYRTGQVECIFDICSTDSNFAVKGSLGSGKTNIALAVAARNLTHGDVVVYLTPFDNLVEQTEDRVAEILSLSESNLHAIRDDWTPKKREHLYRTSLSIPGGHLIISTPGKVLNDISEGRFDAGTMARTKLIVFDECHLAFGKLPYVELMERFRANGSRLLGFTGTMGKDREHRAIILENLAVSEIYSISSPPLQRTVIPRIVELEPTMTVAAEQLGSVAKRLITSLADHLGALSLEFEDTNTGEVAASIRERYLTGPRFTMPVKKGILEIHRDVRQLLSLHQDNGAYYQSATLAHAVDQVHQLHDRLTRFGSYAFLRLAADKLLALQIPDLREEKASGEGKKSQRRVPRYVDLVYRDNDILEVYDTVARGTPFEVVPTLRTLPAALRAIPGDPRRLSHESVDLRHALIEELRNQLAQHDYSDHPKEAAVFSILAHDAGRSVRKPTIIFIELVEAARFLVDRIHTTKDLDTKAVLCVGSGHDVTMKREDAIRAFDAGAAHVIVATSALEVGQDTQTAERIINFIQTPEAIRLAQRMGRAGRSGGGAEIIDLVTKHYEPQYYAGRANLRKMNDA